MSFFTFVLLTICVVAFVLAILWIMYGMRLNMYLMNMDSRIQDQILIPVTMPNKKHSALRSLFKGNWRENVELILTDSRSEKYIYNIQYYIWSRFHISLVSDSNSTSLNGQKLVRNRNYKLKDGMELNLGGRVYKVVVSTNLLDPKEALKSV